MKVSFDGLRTQLAYTYQRLCETLNNSIQESKKEYDDNMIRVQPDEIQEEMDDLRMQIMTLCCCYEEGEDGFKDISEKVKPIDHFNPDEE